VQLSESRDRFERWLDAPLKSVERSDEVVRLGPVEFMCLGQLEAR